MEKNTALVCLAAMMLIALLAAGWLDSKRFSDPRVQAMEVCRSMAASDRPVCFDALANTFKE